MHFELVYPTKDAVESHRPVVEWHEFDYSRKDETKPPHENPVWIHEEHYFPGQAVLGYFDGDTFRLLAGNSDDCGVTHWAHINFPEPPFASAPASTDHAATMTEEDRLAALTQQMLTSSDQAWAEAAPVLARRQLWQHPDASAFWGSVVIHREDLLTDRCATYLAEPSLIWRPIYEMAPGLIESAPQPRCLGCGYPLYVRSHYLVRFDGVPELENR
jgi:hypothetical protein